MEIAERISTLRQVNDLSARQLAALVDVAPSTITRIESGDRQPTFDLAAQILTVLGEPLTTEPYADPAAIAAARLAIDPQLPVRATPDVVGWRARWARIGLVDERGRVRPNRASDLLFRAATVARLPRRCGAVDYDHLGDWAVLAERLAASDVDWALTGDAAANIYYPSADESWPVFYVADIRAAERAAGLTRRAAATGRRITLIPFDGVSELGRTRTGDGTWIAERSQVALDCYGGTARMPEQAALLMGARR